MLQKLHDRLGLRTSPVIFFVAIGVLLGYVVVTLLFTEQVNAFFSAGSDWLTANLSWFYILGVTLFLLFLIYMAFSRFGQVRLGPDDEKPAYSNFAWFAMLFATGIGSILMFWAVAEPVNHFGNPPRLAEGVEPESLQAAHEAIAFTLYHFGLHTWAIFTLPALAFAYFIHKRNLPPRVSSLFQPLLGEGIHGPIGKTIDVVAIIGTIGGVAVSVGLGTLQINSGLSALLGIGETAASQLLIIGAMVALATLSVAMGLDKGIKRLSNLNIIMAIGLLAFVVVSGPTLDLLKGAVESAGIYISHLPGLALWNDTFGGMFAQAAGNEELANRNWQGGWTVFYWAWTITWSPFVGIFIARISRGRTIKQFVAGVLGTPTLFTILWFGIFATATFYIQTVQGGDLVTTVVDEQDIPGALFAFLSYFPFSDLVSGIAIVIVAIFFVTSLDSAGLTTDMISTGHADATPTHQRVVWTLLTGVIAATLLVATGQEGLTALEDTIIVVGLPFFVMGYFQIYALLRALREDAGEARPMNTRRWQRVLPPEEYERRAATDDAGGTVIAPESVPGTGPDHLEELPEVEQPDSVVEYRIRTGEFASLADDPAFADYQDLGDDTGPADDEHGEEDTRTRTGPRD